MTFFELDNAFNGTGGTERPARTALALIFNTSDGASGNPVDGSSGVGTNAKISQSGLAFLAGKFGFVAKIDVLELGGGEISEFVQFDRPGVVAGVMLFNEVIVGLEGFEFVEKLFRSIRFAKFRHPVNETVFIIVSAYGGN